MRRTRRSSTRRASARRRLSTAHAANASRPPTLAGLCIDALCYPSTSQPQRWALCGNGTCDPCEDALSCPATTCAPPPMLITGKPVYDDPNTMTVFVHGFTNSSASTRASQTCRATRDARRGDLG